MWIQTEAEPLMQTLPIAKGEIQVCLSKEHALSQSPVLSFAELRKESFVLIPDGTYIRRTVNAEFKRHQITPHIVISSGQVETLLRLVRKGVGISFIIDFIARQYPDIVVIPLSDPLPIEIGLAWKKDKYLSLASQAFIDFLTPTA
ncbi:MAG: LysR family transcriptional regulator substrate-binding protein [Negativicutes bacterium]